MMDHLSFAILPANFKSHIAFCNMFDVRKNRVKPVSKPAERSFR